MLYDFQQKGVEFLDEHHGGFLWDDPGLGKTRQAIFAAVRLGLPCLVVCPNSLKSWWVKEIRTLFPTIKVASAGQGGRFGKRNLHPMVDPIPGFVIVHYTGLRINWKSFAKVKWATIIIDEAHFVKNRNAKRTKALWRISRGVPNRIGLTATPFGRNPADIWAQLRWLAPQHKALKSYWRFFDVFVDWEWEKRGKGGYRKIVGTTNLELLARFMSKFGIRRTKAQVASQLPEITFTEMPIEMDTRQANVYKILKRKSTVELDFVNAGGNVNKVLIVNALSRLMKMEQWLSHPWTFKDDIKGAKIEWILEWAESFNYPAVIATRFKASSKGVVEALKKLGDDKCRYPITGDIDVHLRNVIIEDWKRGAHQFLVGTIDTIGIGLSFEQAHCMVCYDQLYSTTKMEQLVHRVHRITTDHPVQVIYLYIPDTTNQVVLESFTNAWRQIELVRAFLKHIQGEAYE